MFAMPRSLHPPLGYRLIALITAFVCIAAALPPSSAQSPVAYPPIKLIHLYECAGSGTVRGGPAASAVGGASKYG